MGRKTGGRQKGTPNKRTGQFAEYLEERGLSVPQMASEFYEGLQNPLLALNQLKGDVSPLLVKEIANRLLDKYLAFKSLQLESIKVLAMYAHPKPKEVDAQQPPDDGATPGDLKDVSTGALLQVVGGADESAEPKRGD